MASIKSISFTLAAGERRSLPMRGDFIFLRTANVPISVELVSVELAQKDGANVKITLDPNDKMRPGVEFDSIMVHNTSAVVASCEIVTGNGDFSKPIPDIINVQVTSPVNGTVETAVDQTVAQGNAGAVAVLAADADRVTAYITALAANADTLRLGDSNVDVDRGTPLAPGETILWPSKAACYVCSEGATAAQKVATLVHGV